MDFFKPLLTEKTLRLIQTDNVYVFLVNKKLNKFQIKNWVENQHSVKVVSVKTTIYKGKPKQSILKKRIRIRGQTKTIKKAFVKLKKGDLLPGFSQLEGEERTPVKKKQLLNQK